jgi:hypothetical protein
MSDAATSATKKCPVFLGIICLLGFVGAILKLPFYFLLISQDMVRDNLGTLIILVDGVLLNSFLIATFLRLRHGNRRAWKGLQVVWGIYIVLGFFAVPFKPPVLLAIPIVQTLVIALLIVYIRSRRVKEFCGMVPVQSQK